MHRFALLALLASACGTPDGGDDGNDGSSSNGSTTAVSTTSEDASASASSTTSASASAGSTAGTSSATDATDSADGTTSDDTGSPACDALGERACMANDQCMSITGAEILMSSGGVCIEEPEFVECQPLVDCGAAVTYACPGDDAPMWEFPSTCIPTLWFECGPPPPGEIPPCR